MNLDNLDKDFNLKVPEGYFQALEQEIYAQISISEIQTTNKARVPEGYFDSLEDDILNIIGLEQKLTTSKPDVPAGYFSDMESQILSRINIDGLTQENTDKEYFAALEENILSVTAIDEIQGIQFNKASEEYFDQLEASILNKTIGEKKAKFKVFRNFTFSRGAAAAVIIGLLTYGASLFSLQNKDEYVDVSSDTIIAYLSDQNLEHEDLSFILDDEDDDYFLIDDFSDYEIQQYLQDNGI